VYHHRDFSNYQYRVSVGVPHMTGFQITIAQAQPEPISEPSGLRATNPYVQGLAVLSTTLANILLPFLSIMAVRLVSSISIY
jgi:hypothetical protein